MWLRGAILVSPQYFLKLHIAQLLVMLDNCRHSLRGEPGLSRRAVSIAERSHRSDLGTLISSCPSPWWKEAIPPILEEADDEVERRIPLSCRHFPPREWSINDLPPWKYELGKKKIVLYLTTQSWRRELNFIFSLGAGFLPTSTYTSPFHFSSYTWVSEAAGWAESQERFETYSLHL